MGKPNEHLHSPFHAVDRWTDDFRRIMATRVLESRLGFRKTWYLGALTLGTFTIQVCTGLLLMLYYHPSIPQGYADMKDLEFVIPPEHCCAAYTDGRLMPWCFWYSYTWLRSFTVPPTARLGN